MFRSLLWLACLIAYDVQSLGFAESRAEMLRRQRREEAEVDREWKRKYEDDWKAYLDRTKRSYTKWQHTRQDVRKQYQMDRLSRGLDRLPFRILHR